MNKQDEIKYLRDWSLDLYSELRRVKKNINDIEDDLSTITKRLEKLEGNK